MANLFRTKSLEKLSSPEQLDKLIVINTPMTGIALLGGAFILIAVILWGIFARVPITEEGTGILMRDGDVKSVYADTQGVILKSNISSGDAVKKGDVLYEVGNTETTEAVERLQERIDQVESVTFYSSNDIATADTKPLIDMKTQKAKLSLESNAYSNQLSEVKSQYNKKKEEVSSLKKEMESAEERFLNVDNTSPDYLKLQNDYSKASTAYSTALSELKSLEATMMESELQASAGAEAESVNIAALEEQFETAKQATLNELKSQKEQYEGLNSGMKIKAKSDGIVYSTLVTNGSMVSKDTEVARISEAEEGSDFRAICYISLVDGKKIREGMEVKIYPSTYEKEEYGHMHGVVVNVDEYATSLADLYTAVGEQSLVEFFAMTGPVVEVECEIKKDPNTVSGYEWSSKRGRNVELVEGTFLGGAVIIEEVPPISMLIPKLKTFFNVEVDSEEAKQ